MTTRALVTAAPDTTVSVAAQLLEEAEISHLPVILARRLAGILCICDLDRATHTATVGEIMCATPTVIGVATSTHEAARLMRTLRISCLPVVADGVLVGVVTHGDLRAAGEVADGLLGHARCASCDSSHHIRTRNDTEGVGFCLECQRHSEPPHWNDDLGRGT